MLALDCHSHVIGALNLMEQNQKHSFSTPPPSSKIISNTISTPIQVDETKYEVEETPFTISGGQLKYI